MSRMLDTNLRQILTARWQLCDGDDTGAAALPFHEAWARAALLDEILTAFYDETKAGRVSGLAAPGELDSIGRVLNEVKAHHQRMLHAMQPGK